ncbi:polysaccharide pyruvyl transferase family protein [Sediminibacillus massiliensis]|uniref:polysaccharide pyruvyl transferase family protein n=1 Tax=Sediminibacillus massiliensis TaxID=1926277 RepID=UPI000988709D|nr:polysaccharide pyruvyl transferase family protein [Sediminibacillus massiliensis]
MRKIITDRLDTILKQTKEVTLIGYYGRNNFGDDLMLKNITDTFQQYNLKVNVIAFGEIPWLDNSVNVHQWGENKLEKFKTFQKATKKSSLIIFGGGTCFTDEDGDGFFKFMSFAKLIRKKIAYIGIGIGNLKRTSRMLKTKFLINSSEYLSFRDRHSYDLAKSWKKNNLDKIELVEDPADSLLASYTGLNQESAATGLVVAWRNLERYTQTTIGNDLKKVAQLSVRLFEKYNLKTITIIDTDSYFDKKVGQDLLSLLKSYKDVQVNYMESKLYEEKLKVLQKSQVILTSRLHVAVAAKHFKRKCYVYNYSPKIEYYVNNANNEKIEIFSNSVFADA